MRHSKFQVNGLLLLTSKATQCLREVARNIFMHALCIVKLETPQLRGYSKGDDVIEKPVIESQVTPAQILECLCVSFLVKEIVLGW